MLVSEIPGLRPEEIAVLYAEQESVKPGACCGPVVRSVYIVECCTHGKGIIEINGVEFPFQKGQAYVLLPGDSVKHMSDVQEPRKGVWCALDGASVEKYLKEAGITSKTPFLPSDVFEAVRNWLEMLVACYNSGDPGARLRQTACAYGLLGAVLQTRKICPRMPWLDQAIGYMKTNYAEEINVNSIARRIGLERTYFSARFKQETGDSPYRYLTKLRIQKACFLLKESDHSISEITYLVGLAPHNFSRLFKKEVGRTPLEFRKNGLSRTEKEERGAKKTKV